MSDIMPATYCGTNPQLTAWPELEWLHMLPSDTFYALWLRNPSSFGSKISLPVGHCLYVISFHYEPFDYEWVVKQCAKVNAPVLILNDAEIYNFALPANCFFYNYYSWHYHIEKIQSWFPDIQNKNLQYKVSAVCNRITTHKLVAFTALAEHLGLEHNLVKLGTWLEEKNVNYRKPTNVEELDRLQDIFFSQWYGKEIKADDFENSQHNKQSINSNPWSKFYLDSAIHLCLESHCYSFMVDEFGESVRPGPHMTEKTFKCLIAGTPFIQVGQFDCYGQLKKLGLEFDYGSLDLSWDSDSGNLTRLSRIVNTIKSLKNYSIADIVEMTKESTEHNTKMIRGGDFAQRCRDHNKIMSEKVLDTWA